MKAWNEAKGGVAESLGIAQDLLHIPVGLCLFLAAAALLRKQPNPLAKAFGVVLVIQLLNEVSDGIQWIWWTGTVHWAEALRDTALTLALPLVLILLAAARRPAEIDRD